MSTLRYNLVGLARLFIVVIFHVASTYNVGIYYLLNKFINYKTNLIHKRS
jgi:hypothetical protein